MDFKDKIVIVTGGAQGIGKCIAEEFRKEGATVCVIDKQEGDHYVGDISKQEVLEAFVQKVLQKYGHVDIIVNNALPIMRGVDECIQTSAQTCFFHILFLFLFILIIINLLHIFP